MKINGITITRYVTATEDSKVTLEFENFSPMDEKSNQRYKKTIAPILRGQDFAISYDDQSKKLMAVIQITEK